MMKISRSFFLRFFSPPRFSTSNSRWTKRFSFFFFFFLVSVIVLRRSTKEKRDEWRPMLLRAFVTRYAQKPRTILPRVHADLSICLIYPSIYLSGDFFSNLAARTLDVVYYCQF